MELIKAYKSLFSAAAYVRKVLNVKAVPTELADLRHIVKDQSTNLWYVHLDARQFAEDECTQDATKSYLHYIDITKFTGVDEDPLNAPDASSDPNVPTGDVHYESQAGVSENATMGIVESKRGRGVGAMARTMILAGKTNAEIWEVLHNQFGLDDKKKSYPAWYRSDMRRKGLLTEPNTNAEGDK